MTLPAPGRSSIHDFRVERIANAREVLASPCVVCGEKRGIPTFRIESIDAPVIVCPACGLGRFEPMLSDAEIAALYTEDYYGKPGTKFRPIVERLVRAVAARHIAFLSRGLVAGARILDVGCGRGVLFGPLASKGFRVYGVEVNEDAARGCDPRAEVRIAPRLSQAAFDDAMFDLVVIWHVLEHLPAPTETIAECRRILKPGGRLIIAVPNFSSAQARWSGPDWFHLDPPRHLYHFPYAALCQMVENAGFAVASSHHFSLRQKPFGWIQSALNRFTRQPSGGLYTLLHRGEGGRTVPFGGAVRAAMWAALVLGAPIALALSVIAAVAKSGATVHIVAVRRADA
jgi:2-polyprenyl-3-methyl-5-hydroxy-6-metoxy-1,4-benzoquinol methylase